MTFHSEDRVIFITPCRVVPLATSDTAAVINNNYHCGSRRRTYNTADTKSAIEHVPKPGPWNSHPNLILLSPIWDLQVLFKCFSNQNSVFIPCFPTLVYFM